MRAIDTNVLLRILVRDHAVQVAAADAFVARGAWVSHLVLAEAIWVLESVYSMPRGELAAAASLVLQHKDLTIQEPEIVARALDHFRGARKVEFADCLMLEIARKAGHIPVATFDRNFAKVDGVQRLG